MKKLEFWGAVLTTIYLSLMGWWIYGSWDEFLHLKLNELGDFLAGTKLGGPGVWPQELLLNINKYIFKTAIQA